MFKSAVTGHQLCPKNLCRALKKIDYAYLNKSQIVNGIQEPHQQIKWAGNGDGSNVRLGVRWTGNGDGSNVRLGVRLTRESLDYAQGVLSNLNYTI